MTEQQIELDRVQKALVKNTQKIKTATQNAAISAVHIKTCESQIKYQDLLHNDRVNKLKAQIDRGVENSKLLHDKLEALLEEKEALHLQLKVAANFGRIQCEHCLRFFSPQGIKRHSESCASKPETKTEELHIFEVKEIKDDIEAKKAALQKQLADLEGK